MGMVAELRITSGTAAGTPASGKITIYSKTDKLLYLKDDAGVETKFLTVASGTPAILEANNTFSGTNTFSTTPSTTDLDLTLEAAPSSPVSGKARLYAETGTGLLRLKQTSGVIQRIQSVSTAGTAHQVFRTGGSGEATFGAVDLAQSASITGVLPSANGGTGVNNSTRTLTVNTNAGTLAFAAASQTLTVQATGKAVVGVAFRAYKAANQTISNNTWTKILLDTETFDTGGDFASYKFTPQIAGIYQFNGVANWELPTSPSAVVPPIVSIYKNGVAVCYLRRLVPAHTGTAYDAVPAPALISMNGSTDYVEFYVYQNSGGSIDVLGGTENVYLEGHLVAYL